MKKAMRLVVMTVAVLSTTVNYATTSNPKVGIQFSIQEGKILKENLKVVIRNKRGVAIFEGTNFTTSSKEELISDMNLPNGSYTFEIVGDTKIEITSFEVDETIVIFDTIGVKTIFTPTLRVKGDLVLVNQLSLLKEPLTIKLYYRAKEDDIRLFDLIYTERIGEEMILDRVYNLDDSKKGDYKIKFISNGREFTESFTY